MSGGTDSSVAAMKLQEAGYEVVGVTFRFYERNGDMQYLEDAKQLAQQIGIEHIVVDVREQFEEEIIQYFLEEYMAGHTPVPCTLCNNRLKWPLLAKLADEMEIYHIATGHYVNIIQQDGYYFIAPAKDVDKDQSFFLWGLNQPLLKRMLLPMGALTKQEAREYASQCGHQRVATKHDSIGVCFCPMDYRNFLLSRVGENRFPGKGKFLDESGQFLGWHEGYPFYTIGQRRGLGIHLNRAVFVKEISVAQNEVVLAPLSSLYKNEMRLKEWNLISPERVLDAEEVIVKIRYRKQANRCKVHVEEETQTLHVQLLEPLESIASGQAAAFYNKEGLLLGGGIII